MDKELQKIQSEITDYKIKNPDASVGELNDNHHSFNDLYKHRTVLTALAFIHLPYAWKSATHEDGSMYDGMFIVGAPTPEGMITYHYDNEYWDLFKVPVLPHAPHFDGHTPEQVIERLTNYIKNSGSRLVGTNNIDAIEKVVSDYILPVFGDNTVAKAAFIGFYNR